MLAGMFAARGGSGPPPVDPIYAYSPKVVHDLLDLATVFQDSAGTTLALADGDPVGLILNQAPGYAAADWMQSNATYQPILRISGGIRWLEFNGTAWMYSRAVDALAFVKPYTIIGIRPESGFADYGPFIGHPYATSHTSPFWIYTTQGRTSGGVNNGIVYQSGAANNYSNDAEANIGVDAIFTTGHVSMYRTGAGTQNAGLRRVSKVEKFSGFTTFSGYDMVYANSNVSTLGAHAAGVVPMVARYYGDICGDLPVTSQTEIDTFENWQNIRLENPV